MEEESYIVRIYRRSRQNPQGDDGLVGVIEDIQHERCAAFRNLEELVAILANQTEQSRVPGSQQNKK